MTDQERFKLFTEELSKLSIKYGIIIQSVGGVTIFAEDELLQIRYSSDSTSGDLYPYVKQK